MFAIFGRKFSENAQTPHGCHNEDMAFMASLYQKYRLLLFSKAGIYTNDTYAQEDIVQDAVLRLTRNSKRLQTLEPAALAAYITLTVRSAALNYLKAEHRDRLDALPFPEDDEIQQDIVFECGPQLSLEEQMLLGHRDEEVRAAIARLPERDQAVLLGKYFLELDNQELTELLGVTAGGLRVLLYRARKRVLKELAKEGILHG